MEKIHLFKKYAKNCKKKELLFKSPSLKKVINAVKSLTLDCP